MLRINADLAISQNKRAVAEFILPTSKCILDDDLIPSLQAVVLSISRDAFTLSMAIERLENPDNNHARHLLLDRDGTLYQFARLDQPIYHLPMQTQRRRINNGNSVAIELVNAGKLFRSTSIKHGIVLRGRDEQGEQALILPQENIRDCETGNKNNQVSYEITYYQQFQSLSALISALRRRYPTLQVLDCERWTELTKYALSPNFPRRRLDTVGVGNY